MMNTPKERALMAYYRTLEKLKIAQAATENARKVLAAYQEEEKEAEVAAREAEKKWRSSG